MKPEELRQEILNTLAMVENELCFGGNWEDAKARIARCKAQIDKIKDNRPTREEIRIRVIDYVMADGDTNKFIEWLEEKLLVC